tara:strand:+ start:81 stop:470 length:390 start_codon:yes stop_codon:yes gene_type:complete
MIDTLLSIGIWDHIVFKYINPLDLPLLLQCDKTLYKKRFYYYRIVFLYLIDILMCKEQFKPQPISLLLKYSIKENKMLRNILIRYVKGLLSIKEPANVWGLNKVRNIELLLGKETIQPMIPLELIRYMD